MKQNKLLDEIIQFFTDAATLVVYDPVVIQERIQDSIDWWCVDFKELEEVKNGLISLVSLSNDGSYKVRVTTESLTQNEKDFARSVMGPLGVTSKSGKVFIGQGECLPGEGDSISSENVSPREGKFIELPVGNYDLLFYYIKATDYANQKLVNSLPDIVIVISERAGDFSGVDIEPRINDFVETFLFPSIKNASKLKPKLNKKIRARVFSTKRTSSGLALKDDGPWPSNYRGFEIVLEDMSQVEWKDRILIKTTRLDDENKIIYAELIEKLPRED
jgi:hypothetical protein